MRNHELGRLNGEVCWEAGRWRLLIRLLLLELLPCILPRFRLQT